MEARRDAALQPQPTKSREDGFESSKETEVIRTKADRMMNEALNQAPDAVHFNPKSKRTTRMVTLYAGNLDFKANGKGILESLQKCFRHRVQVNETATPMEDPRDMPSSLCPGFERPIRIQLKPANSTLT